MAIAITVFLCLVATGAGLFVCFLFAVAGLGVLGWFAAEPKPKEARRTQKRRGVWLPWRKA